MTDVDTANAVKNSHIINANKVVITVVEPDHNTKVDAISTANETDGVQHCSCSFELYCKCYSR